MGVEEWSARRKIIVRQLLRAALSRRAESIHTMPRNKNRALARTDSSAARAGGDDVASRLAAAMKNLEAAEAASVAEDARANAARKKLETASSNYERATSAAAAEMYAKAESAGGGLLRLKGVGAATSWIFAPGTYDNPTLVEWTKCTETWFSSNLPNYDE